jgi:nucleoside-diphosphate-sugar epimerase
MHALVTGASGFLGHVLVRQLSDAGVPVIAAIGPDPNEAESRRIQDLRKRQIPIIPSELRRERPLEEVPAEWDTLFHLAAYTETERDSEDVHINDAGTARLLGQLPLANKRVIYTSTLAVADNASGGITLDTVCEPRTAYGKTKLAAETIVREQCGGDAASHTIVRMPTLYGPGFRKNGMFDVLPRQLAAKNPLARLAWPGRMALMAVQDAARALRLAAGEPSAANRTFLASSNENPTTWEVAQEIALSKGIAYRKLGFPELASTALRVVLGDWWQVQGVPHTLQIASWRARLLLEGLYCDGSELAKTVGLSFGDWREGFRQMYAQDFRHAGTSPPFDT